MTFVEGAPKSERHSVYASDLGPAFAFAALTLLPKLECASLSAGVRNAVFDPRSVSMHGATGKEFVGQKIKGEPPNESQAR